MSARLVFAKGNSNLFGSCFTILMVLLDLNFFFEGSMLKEREKVIAYSTQNVLEMKTDNFFATPSPPRRTSYAQSSKHLRQRG